MQRSRKPKDFQNFELGHPFLRWYAAYHKRDAARSQGQDLFMGELAARRFSVGLDDDKVPLFGVAEDDLEAFSSLKWSAAAFLRRVQGRDWIALSCRDARVENASSDAPVPLRLWLPTTIGLLDGWVGLPEPSSLRVVETAIRKGTPVPKGGSPLAILPLSLKGDWKAPAVEAKQA